MKGDDSMETLFEKIATQNQTTPEEVQAEIIAAIQAAIEQSDAATQEIWHSMSPDHKMPTPEEAVIGIMALLVNPNEIVL